MYSMCNFMTYTSNHENKVIFNDIVIFFQIWINYKAYDVIITYR